MSNNDVAIVPVKEVLTPFTGRQMLETAINNLKAAHGLTELSQVLLITPDQLRTMNRRAAAADYFITKVQRLVSAVHEADKEGRSGESMNLFYELRDFALEAKEKGDDDEPS